ncbi:MAG TPA: hypothetical protein VF153_00155 [Candidatus Limnocylindria bacterium]
MNHGIQAVADALGATDVLVLEREAGRLRLLGGVGRDASWAGSADDGDELHDALRAADERMYLAKREASRVWSYWAISMERGAA